MILEFLKVLASWPPVCLAIFVLFILTFKDPIATWLKNFRVKYGEAEFSSQASRGTDSEIDIAGAKVDQSTASNASSSHRSDDEAAQWRAAAYLWEYRYLNHHLVFHTQQFLDWLAGLQKPIKVGVADVVWTVKVPSSKERQAVVEALEQHHLISVENQTMSLTPKGREYIQLRGAFPPAFPELEATANLVQ